jgi:hypothetical protein
MNLTGQGIYEKDCKPKIKTQAEREYMEKVASLPCYVSNHECGGSVEVHHKTGAGMAKKASNFDVMPLCFNHHSAQTPLGYGHSVHKGTKLFEGLYGTQDHMIFMTKKRVERL